MSILWGILDYPYGESSKLQVPKIPECDFVCKSVLSILNLCLQQEVQLESPSFDLQILYAGISNPYRLTDEQSVHV